MKEGVTQWVDSAGAEMVGDKIVLTKKMIEDAEPCSVMAKGETVDGEEGLNMSRSGRRLRFVVYRGGAPDWCIYCGLEGESWNRVEKWGDKPNDRGNIERLVDFSDEVWEMYRH